MRPTSNAMTAVLLASALWPVVPAQADLVASGSSTIALVITSTDPVLLPVGSYASMPRSGFGAFPSKIVWDDAVETPFGVPVNFGQQVGTSWVDGGTLPSSPTEGAFSQLDVGNVAGTYAETSTGTYLCTDASCNQTSFVGSFTSHSGSALAGLPPDTVYTFDGTTSFGGLYVGTSRIISGVSVGYNLKIYGGRVAINAFLPTTTAASPPGCEATNSCAVEVTKPVEYTLPDGTSGAADVSITYPEVITAGTTTVSAMSDAPGDLPTDVAIEVGGYRAVFFELQTTAVYDTSSGPIEVCFSYDLTGTSFQPSELRFLHRENGVFVDRTSRLDEANGALCGALTSFSPVVLAVSVECHTDLDCDDANPCSADACVVGKCQFAVDPQCKQCSTPADCDDANPCTFDKCTGGVCGNPFPAGCFEADKASLQFKIDGNSDKNKLTWKYAGRGVHFGAPTTTTGYTFCVLDQNDAVLASAQIPAGAPYWATKLSSASYKDKDLVQGGINALKMKAKYGAAGSKSAITMNGKGSSLQLPSIPSPLPLKAVLWSDDLSTSVSCWQSTLDTATKNADGSFSAKK